MPRIHGFEARSGELARRSAHEPDTAHSQRPHELSQCSGSDGRRAVSASADQTLRLWDLKSGKEIATFTGESAICSFGATLDGFIFQYKTLMIRVLYKPGGGSGIRTHGSLRIAGFQDRCFQPLSHPSKPLLDLIPCRFRFGNTWQHFQRCHLLPVF
jgi:hypothetical protein